MTLPTYPVISLAIALFFATGASYQPPYAPAGRQIAADTLYHKLTEAQKRSPAHALAGIDVADGVQAVLFAAEPMLINPTAIDIDHKGRVWVCEAYNYRPAITGKPANPKGDRIVILEDTDGDGKADKQKIFYQDPELNAPIGIWVMGNKAVVSQSPYVWLLTDEDGDDIADKKEVIFSGIEGEQHDHGIHSFVFGPDGKFYCAIGNEGKQLKDKNGQPLKDKNGKAIDFSNYRQGLLIRCDEDFSNVEVLGHNFRNNYEAAVDSYGNIWQSDNDDDGNRGVRINFVMEHGNYGYTDELTGAGWRANRTNLEDSIPFRHWHLNDPGVVPNLLQTGAGSPTGMIFYEGDLLPKAFQNQIIHCDAGPNVVRAYPIRRQGAGFTATTLNLLKGERDQWFRPSDICTAPDGSVFVSDWYDPGVGGHQMGDMEKGRIYRLAPDGSRYTLPAVDLESSAGAVAALSNPNLSIRYLAWKTLQRHPVEAAALLKKQAANPAILPVARARSIWALSKMLPLSDPYWIPFLTDPNPNLRITLIRAFRQLPGDISPLLARMAADSSPQVRREIALSLYGRKTPAATAAWVKLAQAYEGDDRWYLEALGIGAEGNWDALFEAWAATDGLEETAARDIIWRARTPLSVPGLARLAGDPTVPLPERLRYFRAFDFNPGGKEKSEALLKLMKGDPSGQLAEIALRHLDPGFVKTTPVAMAEVQKVLDAAYGTTAYMELVQRFEPAGENQRLLEMALQKPYDGLGRTAAQQLLRQEGLPLIQSVINGKDIDKSSAVLASLSRSGSTVVLDLLQSVALDTGYPLPLRRDAIRSMAGSMPGEDRLLEYLRNSKLEGELKATAIQSMGNAWRKAVRAEANSYIDAAAATAVQKHPPVSELTARTGDSSKGKTVFVNYCSACHQVNGEGADFGPKLSEIGDKLPKEAQYLALYYPSAGISFGYEGYEVKFKDGATVVGIISSKTETDLILKFPGGGVQEYKMSAIASMKQLDESLMTPGLHEAMTTAELVDLVEYLSGLKKL